MDVEKAVVSQICDLVLVRRDSWLHRMSPEISQEAKEDLRCSVFNGCSLFGRKGLEKARKSMREEKEVKVQNSLIECQAKLSQGMKEVTTAVSKNKDSDKPPKFGRWDKGGQNASTADSKERLESDEDTPETPTKKKGGCKGKRD